MNEQFYSTCSCKSPAPPPPLGAGGWLAVQSPLGRTPSWTGTWTHVTNQTDAGSVCAVSSTLVPVLESDARGGREAWVLCTMSFPFRSEQSGVWSARALERGWKGLPLLRWCGGWQEPSPQERGAGDIPGAFRGQAARPAAVNSRGEGPAPERPLSFGTRRGRATEGPPRAGGTAPLQAVPGRWRSSPQTSLWGQEPLTGTAQGSALASTPGRPCPSTQGFPPCQPCLYFPPRSSDALCLAAERGSGRPARRCDPAAGQREPAPTRVCLAPRCSEAAPPPSSCPTRAGTGMAGAGSPCLAPTGGRQLLLARLGPVAALAAVLGWRGTCANS